MGDASKSYAPDATRTSDTCSLESDSGTPRMRDMSADQQAHTQTRHDTRGRDLQADRKPLNSHSCSRLSLFLSLRPPLLFIFSSLVRQLHLPEAQEVEGISRTRRNHTRLRSPPPLSPPGSSSPVRCMRSSSRPTSHCTHLFTSFNQLSSCTCFPRFNFLRRKPTHRRTPQPCCLPALEAMQRAPQCCCERDVTTSTRVPSFLHSPLSPAASSRAARSSDSNLAVGACDFLAPQTPRSRRECG